MSQNSTSRSVPICVTRVGTMFIVALLIIAENGTTYKSISSRKMPFEKEGYKAAYSRQEHVVEGKEDVAEYYVTV